MRLIKDITNCKGGEKIRLNRKLILLLIVTISLITLTSVAAVDSQQINNNLTIEKSLQTQTDLNDTNLLSSKDNSNIGLQDDILQSEEEEVPDVPDLIVNETYYVHASDIDDYFDDGVLKPQYSNKILVFTGNFQNIGKLIIDVDNVTIKGANSYLKNTVFDISGDDVTLSDLNIDLDSQYEDNDGAGILISSDNVVLTNLNINYIVPVNVEAYAIYAVGNPRSPSKSLKILNSNIYFEGHNDDLNVYNVAVKVMNYDDSSMDNNTIITSLPLKNVNHGNFGTTLDSDFVLTVGIEKSDNFVFTNNALVSDVNSRPGSTYPTLDCMMFSRSDNGLILNNSIYMTDFISAPGIENYLYGLDVYSLNNLKIAYNNISIITTGGKLALGTAYPIQITGPISAVNVTENDLYTFSNGPNIGIYSQNYYGGTELSITNNRINVTGLAGTHEWALVAGIESQDSNSYIVNNTIEVHSVGAVNVGDNIYGVSYRQSTAGNHTYNIQNNTVFSDGYSSVYLLSSVNSTVANNLLVSYNENAKNGQNGFGYGDLSSHDRIAFYNNQVIRAFDYFASLNNNLDGGNEYDYTNPINNGISNNVDGRSISSKEGETSYNYNPLIPGSAKYDGNYDQSGVKHTIPSQHDNDGDKKDDSSDDGVSGTLSLKDFLMNYVNSNQNNNGEQSNTTSENTQSHSSNVVSNSTSDSSPSNVGDTPLTESESSAPAPAGAGGSHSVSKAYELEDLLNNQGFISSVFYVIAAMILLIVGYRRRNQNLE